MATQKPLVLTGGVIQEMASSDAVSAATSLKNIVMNMSGATMALGAAVYVSSANGDNPVVSLAQANTEATSSKTVGLLESSISHGGTSNVIQNGLIVGLDTSTATIGDPVWLSPTTAGGLLYGLANKPVAPNHLVFIGKVVRVHANQGSILVNVQNGFELNELHDVLLTSVADNNVLTYESASGLWKNKASQGASAVNISGDTTIYVSQAKTYTITNYNSFSTYSVSVSNGSVSIVGDTISFTAPSTAQTVILTVTKDGVGVPFSLPILGAGVATPTNSTPANGATDQNSSVTLSASAFAWLGLADTHLNSDWQLATDSGFTSIVQSANADTTNKTSWTVSGLSVSTTYYWRVRYRGVANGVSAWSTGTSFMTKSSFGGLIGTAGGQGFGVGEYPSALPAGFSAMSGTSDKASANYGNYQYSDGSVMCFVPKFFYRIGNAASPRYAVYGANAVDIVGIETYANETAANAAGYAMHRAFKDGGSEKSGFFIDKYLASKNGTTSCKSIQNGNPISLTTNASYNPSNGMTTPDGSCTGILADAIMLARSRGVGIFNVASIFTYSACALLSLAHAQASTSTTYNAWYDSGLTINFPKGCNNGSLADVNDATVTFSNATPGVDTKPLTGSASNLAKTSHNGQSCGVVDLNGAIWQVVIGVTSPGASGTDSVVISSGDAYVLNSSFTLANLTSGFGGANDAWGTSANLTAGSKYSLVTGLLSWGATTGWTYFGNGSNNVFSGSVNGNSHTRTSCGIQDATSGTNTSGTAQFGNDGCYQYNRANVLPLASGSWYDGAPAGVFFRDWNGGRARGSHAVVGFRACAYGS
jgi:hypothetical protein